ncbi:unnamed protein product [Acanthocheilonema viteae]|uniref:Secreted protein n=1 Tax=Acanthocheilonema viteae TaxID=6277 RepID=A0A498S8J0_ACAVI|nr:unnamed protein product [Acanthocheilonema viteae]
MTKLIVYLAFCICCQRAANQQAQGAAMASISVAKVLTDCIVEKFWNNGQLIATMQVEQSTITNCGTMEDGRPSPISFQEKSPLQFMINTLNLIK